MDADYLKGVDYALRLWHTHDSAGQDMGNRMIGMFRSNDKSLAVPLIIDLPTYYSQIPLSAPELKGKWDIFPWPKADEGSAYNVIGGTSYVIFRSSKHKKEAFEWLKYLNSLEAQQFMILDRLNRGDESGFMISPVREVWGPGNDAFWRRPELESSRRIHDTLAQVMDTFTTVPPVHGAVEAGAGKVQAGGGFAIAQAVGARAQLRQQVGDGQPPVGQVALGRGGGHGRIPSWFPSGEEARSVPG